MLGDSCHPLNGMAPTTVGTHMGHNVGICHSTFVGNPKANGHGDDRSDYQPICILFTATLTVPGHTSKLPRKRIKLIKLAAQNILTPGTMVICNYVTPKTGKVSMILINTNNNNVQI